MGTVGDKIRNSSGGQVTQGLGGHGKDNCFNSECSKRILEGFEQRWLDVT